MLSVSSYAETYIDGCRVKIDARISAYEGLVRVARGLGGTSETRLEPALDTFEPLFCNNMVNGVGHLLLPSPKQE